MNPAPFLDWRGCTAVIAASGPSLTGHEEFPKGYKVITTNTSWQRMPTAEVYFAVDALWWKLNYKDIPTESRRKCWTQDRLSAEMFNLNWVRQAARPGLGLTALHTNGNSGFGAINLAFLFGARKILLLGFDMREVNGKKHWHPDHPPPCVQSMPFGEWIHKSAVLARDLEKAGCDVVNCTPGSALTAFRMSTIEKELSCL